MTVRARGFGLDRLLDEDVDRGHRQARVANQVAEQALELGPGIRRRARVVVDQVTKSADAAAAVAAREQALDGPDVERPDARGFLVGAL
jgi:hypothetical protein